MKKVLLTICFTAVLFAGCATSNQRLLKIDSMPSEALVSVHEVGPGSSVVVRRIVGITPVEKKVDFGEENRLRLEIEKRGYVSKTVEVAPDAGMYSIHLERMKDGNGENVKEYIFPVVNRLLLVVPDFKVVKRGFSKESVSEEDTGVAKEALVTGIGSFFSGKYEVMPLNPSHDDKRLKALWRDARTAMELLDPISLKYLPDTPFLETGSSREAARELGAEYDSEVVLFVYGKQNRETAGMKFGKIGVTTAQTAVSYTSSYNNAVSRGDSFFVYNVYTPNFAEGTLLKAVLIDCHSGEILWANRGIWGRISFNDADTVKTIIADLLVGLD